MKKYDRWYRLGDTGLKINFYRMALTGIIAFLSGLFFSAALVIVLNIIY